MSTNIYVGNLPFSATENEIRQLFSAYGTVDKPGHRMLDASGALRKSVFFNKLAIKSSEIQI